jgi:hypothetical protein
MILSDQGGIAGGYSPLNRMRVSGGINIEPGLTR